MTGWHIQRGKGGTGRSLQTIFVVFQRLHAKMAASQTPPDNACAQYTRTYKQHAPTQYTQYTQFIHIHTHVYMYTQNRNMIQTHNGHTRSICTRNPMHTNTQNTPHSTPDDTCIQYTHIHKQHTPCTPDNACTHRTHTRTYETYTKHAYKHTRNRQYRTEAPSRIDSEYCPGALSDSRIRKQPCLRMGFLHTAEPHVSPVCTVCAFLCQQNNMVIFYTHYTRQSHTSTHCALWVHFCGSRPTW